MALPAMRAARFGRIVNISSRAVQGRPYRTVYSMTKGGLLSMTRTWALEFAADGITANAIGPGPVDTETFRRNNAPAAIADVLEAIPMKRLAAADDVAQAVSFFLDARSGYITGQMLHVCGGQTPGGAAGMSRDAVLVTGASRGIGAGISVKPRAACFRCCRSLPCYRQSHRTCGPIF